MDGVTTGDFVHVEFANQALFANGDGRTRLFPLRIGDHRITPTALQQVQITDWQGSPTPAYSFARENYLSNSFDFTAERGWQPVYDNPSVLEQSIPAPDGRNGRTQSIRLGDCTGGPNSDTAGVYSAVGAELLHPGSTYLASMWVRSEVPLTVSLNGTDVTVDTTWTRVSHSFVAPSTGAQRLLTFSLSSAGANAAVDPDTKVFFTYAQVEVPLAGEVPGRYIETNGAPTVAVDFTLNDSNVIFTTALQNGGNATWTGTGYWVEGATHPIAPPMDLKVGMTWRLDQSPNLNRLLDQKRDWYASNFSQFWEGWYSSVFRLKSANLFGVAVWAYILGLPLGVLGLQEEYRYWGFGPTRGNYRLNEDVTAEEQPSSGNFPPTTPGNGAAITTPWEKVAALRIRYYALTSDCSISSINKALQDVFGDVGFAYVLDHEDMTMTYVFDFPVSFSFQQAMLQYGLLPKPAGVRLNIQVP